MSWSPGPVLAWALQVVHTVQYRPQLELASEVGEAEPQGAWLGPQTATRGSPDPLAHQRSPSMVSVGDRTAEPAASAIVPSATEAEWHALALTKPGDVLPRLG